MAEGVLHLPHHAQAVLRVALEDLLIQRQRRLELRELHRRLHSQHLDAEAEHIQSPAGIGLRPHAVEQCVCGG